MHLSPWKARNLRTFVLYKNTKYVLRRRKYSLKVHLIIISDFGSKPLQISVHSGTCLPWLNANGRKWTLRNSITKYLGGFRMWNSACDHFRFVSRSKTTSQGPPKPQAYSGNTRVQIIANHPCQWWMKWHAEFLQFFPHSDEFFILGYGIAQSHTFSEVSSSQYALYALSTRNMQSE